MTCKLSANFFLARSPPLCLRRCREGVVTGALKRSPNDQQLRGVWRDTGRKMWVFPLANSKFQKSGPVCVHSVHVKVVKVQRRTDCCHPRPSCFCSSALFPLCCLCCVCSSPACLRSVWSAAEPCGVLLQTNQTSQCHWADLSKAHGHVRSFHSPALQCLAGTQAKEV